MGMGVDRCERLGLPLQSSKEPSYNSEQHISSRIGFPAVEKTIAVRIVFPDVEKTIVMRIVFPEVEKTIAMLYGLIELHPDGKGFSSTYITRKPSPTEGTIDVSGRLSGATTPAPRDGFTNSMERREEHVKSPPAASGSPSRDASGPRGRLTDPGLQKEYLRRADGNIDKAHWLARKDGWEW